MISNLMMGVHPSLKVLTHSDYLLQEGDILIMFILNYRVEKVSLVA